MKVAILIGMLIGMMSMTSCITVMNVRESGVIETRSGKIETFDELEVSSNIKVKFFVAPEFSYTIQSDTVVLNKVELTQIGGKIRVGYKDFMSFNSNITTLLDIYVPNEWLSSKEFELDASGASRVNFDTLEVNFGKMDIDISGASSFEATRVKSAEVELEASGASTGRIKGEFGRIKLDVSGASTVNAGGTAEVFVAEASGASSINAGNLKSAKVESAQSSGASNISFGEAREIEDMRASGASSIHYSGEPERIQNQSSSGASKISRK